jgi:ATPase subunit of ABC transporter with duplicated ATPase domains
MSLFNPAVWIGFLLSLAASFGFGYYKGGIDEYLKQQAEIARLNDEARQKEQALVTAVQTQATQLVKAEQNAKVLSQKRNTDIDSGALKLRIPVKTPICPIQTSTDAPIASRDSVQANAELDRETAKTLIAITDDGDKAIRQLNSCIDAYNAVYQTLKGNP